MKKLVYAITFFSVTAFSLVACKKAELITEYLQATDFWKDVGPNHQTFLVNAVTGGTIIGAKGTKIDIPGGAFIDANGNIITEMVSLNLVEVPTKKDILFSGVLTEANGQLLVSGGEFLVEARKQNGDALQLNPQLVGAGQGVRVEVPAENGADRDMKLFVRRERQPGGQQNNNDDPKTWTPASYAPFGGGSNSYVFNLPEFQWVNIDKFYSDPRPKTTVTSLPSFKDNNNVSDLEVIMVFKDVTTVCPIPFNSSIQKFESYHNAVPVGAEVIVVIIGKDSDGHIQFGKKEVIVTNGMHLDIEIGKTIQTDIDSFLATLQ